MINNSVFSVILGSEGGAIDNAYFGTSSTISNCLFIDNIAQNFGGAIFTDEFSTTTSINSSVFINNVAEVAVGAVFNDGSMSLTGNTFVGNTVPDNIPGQPPVGGGAIFNGSILNMSGNVFVSNSATNGGDGGAIFNSQYATITTARDTFVNNSALQGGAIYIPQFANTYSNPGSLTASYDVFVQNAASQGSATGPVLVFRK